MLCTTGSFYAKSDTFQSNISHVAKLFPLPMKLQAFGSFLVELINISALYFCRPAVFLSLTFIEMDRVACKIFKIYAYQVSIFSIWRQLVVFCGNEEFFSILSPT